MVAHFQLVQPDDVRFLEHFLRGLSVSLIIFLRSFVNTWRAVPELPVRVSSIVATGGDRYPRCQTPYHDVCTEQAKAAQTGEMVV